MAPPEASSTPSQEGAWALKTEEKWRRRKKKRMRRQVVVAAF
jgi:hypothetical protein